MANFMEMNLIEINYAEKYIHINEFTHKKRFYYLITRFDYISF